MTRVEIRHRSRNHARRGEQQMPVIHQIALDPAAQPMLKRLGEATSEINAGDIDRIAHVCLVASTIIARKALR